MALVKRVGYLPVGERNVWLLDSASMNGECVSISRLCAQHELLLLAHRSLYYKNFVISLTDLSRHNATNS